MLPSYEEVRAFDCLCFVPAGSGEGRGVALLAIGIAKQLCSAVEGERLFRHEPVQR
jgi:hypothetical protein